MDENYLNIVRKSLYRSSGKDKGKTTQKMPRKAKKLKFSMDRYDSETVFQNKEKSEKIENRKSTPFKKKLSKKRKVVISQSDSSFEEETNGALQKLKNRKPTPFKKKASKKRKLVLSFNSNDSFEEDVKDTGIAPSKSELEIFQNTFNKSANKNTEQFQESSESEESLNDFNLDTFFNSCEPSVNESITEAHSGIDNEFDSEYISDARIIGKDLFLFQNNKNHTEDDEVSEDTADEEIICTEDKQVENTNNMIEVSDEVNTISDDTTELNIAEVANKIRETIVLSDDVTEEINPVTISERPQLQEEEYPVEYHAAEYYDIGDWQLIVLKPLQSITVYGLLTLQVLYGKLNILGSILDKNTNEITLYSPRGSALIQITNVTSTENNKEENINEILYTLSITEMDNVHVEGNTALIKCAKLEDVQMSFVEKYISQQIFPRSDNYNLPQTIFEPTGNWNVVKESYSWDEILGGVRQSTKLMFAGGKGVGKSTFLRFTINRLLNIFDKVRVVDLDPGQSEFAVPGCISVVTITEPVFGPSFTHLKTTDRSLLSNINVAYNPKAYIKCIQSLMEYCQTLDECPTFINYMGFAQGIGLDIISSAITYIQPTDIVQIRSRNNKKNFITELTVEVVAENSKLLGGSSATFDYTLHRVRAMNDDNDGWTLEPRQGREMCVLAYLGRMMSAGVNSLTSHKLPMYKIKLSAIKITNPQAEEISPAAVNANLVALCSLEEESTIFVCLGYGIVRGIDLESDTLVLLTPEAPSVLENVSYLVLGSVTLPPSICMTPDEVRGSIPYVMEGVLVSLGQITKRTYLPVNRK